MTKKLSIVIPCYNEKNTIEKILTKIEEVDLGEFEKEIIIVDDFSTDGTRDILRALENRYNILYNKENRGKGYSLRRGFEIASGNFVIVQDADLEYNPQNYKDLLQEADKRGARVVYGSRERNTENKKHSGFSFYLGALFVTKLTNVLFGSRLTDQPTCYKMFDRQLLNSIDLKEERFGFCSEVTAKVLLKGEKIYEVPIDYYPRNKKEGKKIKWRDGVRAAYVLIKNTKIASFFRRLFKRKVL